MLETIYEITFILLSVVGIVNIWKNFMLFLLRSKQDKNIYIVVPLIDTCENIEQLVRSTAERTLLMGNAKWEKVVCVDYGISDENKYIVEKLCKEYSFIDYISKETFRMIFVK
ncbi:MAG: hypothetical protein UE295_07090 [Acutalibacteraceae bacterium]|nr:hypothetical protein [Acutalibacteraceae bacterium]